MSFIKNNTTNQLSKWKKDALELLKSGLEDGRKKKTDKEKDTLKNEVHELYAQIGELTAKLNWLKKNLASTSSRQERIAMVDFESLEFSLKTQAELLSLNRSSLYYKPVQPSAKEVLLKNEIDVIYTDDPCYGSRGHHLTSA